MRRTLKKLINKLKGITPEEANMKYWIENGLKIGKNVEILSGVEIDSLYCWLISIGDNVVLTPNVKILAHDASTMRALGYAKIGRVEIGNNVFIGTESVILCNTKIGNNVIIGANSTVTKDIPSNSVYAGNPAKFICTYEEYISEQKEKIKKCTKFEKPWYEWKDASKSEKEEMFIKLEDKLGYIR